jgi:DNA repair exonuclease SbcCD ATPase subunit
MSIPPSWMRWGAAALLISLLAGAAWGGSLRDDYRSVVVTRQQLEKQRSQYEVRIKEIKAEQRKLTLALYKCVTRQSDPDWSARLRAAQDRDRELEAERSRLGDLRVSLDSARAALETRRAAIEEKYRGKPKGADYEADFRAYMDALRADYFDRIESDLFSGYEAYINGIEAHVAEIEAAAAECRESL